MDQHKKKLLHEERGEEKAVWRVGSTWFIKQCTSYLSSLLSLLVPQRSSSSSSSSSSASYISKEKESKLSLRFTAQKIGQEIHVPVFILSVVFFGLFSAVFSMALAAAAAAAAAAG